MNTEKTIEEIRRKYRTDSAYNEWLEDNLERFDSEEEEKKFANFRTGNGVRVRDAKNVEEVDKAYEEFKETTENKDGGPGSGQYVHKKGFGISKTRTADKKYNLTGKYDKLKVLKEQVAKNQNGNTKNTK